VGVANYFERRTDFVAGLISRSFPSPQFATVMLG
jgi:hypothetical protein